MAARIDMSWLAQLLTPTPTATPNPDYDVQGNIPYTDPLTGQTSNTMPDNKPYVEPSRWQRVVWPTQSGQVDSMNNQEVMKPMSDSLANLSRIGVQSGNVSRMAPSLQPAITPTQAAVSGYGDFSNPVVTNLENRSVMNAQAGVPQTQSATDVIQAQTAKTAAAGEQQRQPAQESILDQETLNQWQRAFKIEPAQAQLAEAQLRTENTVQPTVAQIREKALQNQLQQESFLTPAQTQLSLTQTKNAQDIASETGRLMPYTTGTMANRAVGDLASSQYMPEQEPFGNKIQDGTIIPFQRNPLGASPMSMQMQLMHDLTGQNRQEIVMPSGKRVTVNMPSVSRAPYNPLPSQTTGGVVPPMSPSLSASSNGPSVTHDTSGSMSPPLSSSSTSTLPNTSDPASIQQEMDKLEAAATWQPQSQAGIRYAYLKQKLAELTGASRPQLQMPSAFAGSVFQ